MRILPAVAVMVLLPTLAACVAEVHPEPYPRRVMVVEPAPPPPPPHRVYYYRDHHDRGYHCPPGHRKHGRC